MKVTQTLLTITTCSSLVWGIPPLAQAETHHVATSTHQAQAKSTTNVMYNGKSVMKINRVIADDPVTHQKINWVDAEGVQSVIRALGIDAHWVPGIDQLVLNMPAGWNTANLPKAAYHKPQSGQFAIIVNSITVGYAHALPVKGTGGSTSIYLPVGYITNTLNRLGIHSAWTPTAWKLSGMVQVADVIPLSGDYSQTFSLQLANKPQTSTGLPEPPVPPLPPVSVALPMNGALKPSNVKFMAFESYPAEDYIQSGTANYMVHAPITSVEHWFTNAYKTQGYQQTGSGSSGNFKTGEHSESFVYTPIAQPDNQQMVVTMSFEETKDHQTLVEYYVTDLVLPPRPSSSYIRGDVSRIDVTVKTYPLQSSPTTQTASITDSAKISDIVDAVNALSKIAPPGMGSSPQADRYEASLTMTLSDGSSVSVTLGKLGETGYYPVVVGNVPLTDVKGTVWNAILSAIGHSTQG